MRASFFVVACGSIPGVHAMSHIPTIFGMDGMDLSMLRIAPDSTQKGRALPGRAFVESDDSLGHPGRRNGGLGLYLSPFCESRPRGIALRPTWNASGGSRHLPSPEGSTRRKGLRYAPIALRATTPLPRALGLRPTVNGETTADGAAKATGHACARRRTVPAPRTTPAQIRRRLPGLADDDDDDDDDSRIA